MTNPEVPLGSPSQPLFSVVVSTFREVADGTADDGSESTLARALRSALAQTYRNLEVILVSDHPPDPVRLRIEALVSALDDPRILYMDSPEHAGLAALGGVCKQIGFQHSSGELLAMLEADNEWTPQFLERAAEAFAADPALDLAYCDSIVRLSPAAPEYQLTSVLRQFSVPFSMLGPINGSEFHWTKPDWSREARDRLLRSNFIDASEAAYRKTSYLAAGGIPAQVDSDWALWSRFLAAGRDNFRHINAVGTFYSTSNWAQHLQYFALSQSERFPISVDMTVWGPILHGMREASYRQKHYTP